MGLSEVAKSWDRLGRTDPMWAVLTDRGRKRWDPREFLATGVREIRSVMDRLDVLGAGSRLGVALDFGCGAGRLTQGLAVAGFEKVIAVDVSAAMIAMAADTVTDPARCQFLVNDRADLVAVDDASVDFVYSCRVLQHMPPELAEGYIREFFRVARPGAPVVFQLPSYPARNLQGTLVRLLPGSIATLLRHGMEMHGTSPGTVRSVIATSGGELLAMDEDVSAGRRWVSYLYVSRRRI